MTTDMIVAESRELMQLTTQMQRHVDRTLAADRKGGEALWEKALAVADARAEATKGGEWGAFLNATGQHERAARRLVAIAERGRLEERFRTAIISGWLTFSVGAIAAQADDELLTNLLEQPTPPTHNQVKVLTARPDNVVRSQLTARPDTGVRSLEAPARPDSAVRLVAPIIAPASPLDAVSEALRKDDTKAAYASARAIIDSLDERKRAFAAIDARVDGKSIATVLAMLDAPKETIPALSAFPPGHVEAGIGAIERRLKDGTPHLAEDVSWADQLRTQLDDARAGMQPEIYGKWSARLDAARNALKKSTSTATSRTVLLQHAEALLANLIDKSTAEEQRLLHAFVNVGSSVHNDFVADELWRCGKKRIGMEIDLEWILTGVRRRGDVRHRPGD